MQLREECQRDAGHRPGIRPCVDFPRGPAAGPPLPWRPWTVLLLLLACLLPRAIAAWNSDVLWADSLHYMYASLALEQGNFSEGFAEFGLNVYPLLLIPLRHLGIDWQTAGTWFSVLVASCAVVPLWGWLRRMFDDRLALIACLVYASHGKLIAISSLVIRDSTFWILLVLTLYCLWRAIGELRVLFFLAGGIALTLAVHTRTEGWLLLIALFGWMACRWPTAKGRRFRLAAGTTLCLAVIPATVTTVNLTWLREHPRWEFFRVEHLRMAVNWWNAASGMHVGLPFENEVSAKTPYLQTPPPRFFSRPSERQSAAAIAPRFSATLVPAYVAERSAPRWLLTFKLLERLAKGCTWVGSFLLLLGLTCYWRIFLRSEHLTLFCMNLLLIAISWIRYWAAGLDLRYFMPIVIVGVPWMALGVALLVAAARWTLQRRIALGLWSSRAVAASVIAVLVACSLLDAPMPAIALMRKHAALGRWIYDRAGPEATLVGNLDFLSLDTYYSNGRVVGTFLPSDSLTARIPPALSQRTADIVVLWNDEHLAQQSLASLEHQITACYGYRRVDAKELPAGENELLVFVRPK